MDDSRALSAERLQPALDREAAKRVGGRGLGGEERCISKGQASTRLQPRLYCNTESREPLYIPAPHSPGSHCFLVQMAFITRNITNDDFDSLITYSQNKDFTTPGTWTVSCAERIV